jgi:hypothetical protein
LRPPLFARLIRSLLVTFAVAQFCRLFAGAAPLLALLVMTFAWASTIASQLAEGDKAGAGGGLWSADTALGFLSGQLLWAAPLVRVLAPDHWFWTPIQTPATLTAVALAATVCCPLLPLWNRVVGQSRTWMLSREFDLPILCSGFFVLSGSLVFAVGAVASLSTVIASRVALPATRTDVRRTSHTLSYEVLKAT